MIDKTKQEKTIDLAWERLYNRLEQDNLLPAKKTSAGRAVFMSTGFRWAASIAILCVCCLTVSLLKQFSKPAEPDLLVLHNEMDATTLATTLDDGSVVYLSKQATIHYPAHFQDNQRKVTLSGNAFFEVSKQQERPFVIDTKVAKIEVFGTFFQVENSDNSAFRLSVRNGEVKVTLKNSNQMRYVRAGETVFLESGALQIATSDLSPFENGFEKIRLKDERLADIVRIINLNSNLIPIEVDDEPGNRRLTFDYAGETPQEVAQLICLALNLNFTERPDCIRIIR